MVDIETNFDKSLKKIEYTFKWTGMLLESAKKTPSQNRRSVCWYFFNLLWINSDVLGAFWWFINGAKKGESLTSLTYAAPCITLTLLSNIKSIYFFLYQDHVNQLLSTLRNLELKYVKDLKDERKIRIVTEGTASLHMILKLLNFFNWCLIIAFSLMTMVLMLINYMRTNNFELLLPLLIEYPFDAFNIKIWPFVYARQIWSITSVVLEVCGTDYLFYICSTYICIQFRLLSYDIENLLPNRPHKVANDDDIQNKIRQFNLWHLQLVESVRFLEVIYSKSTLFNFVSSSALICLTGFNVTTIDDVAFVVSFLSFLFMSLLQIFFLCFYGDMLMKSSVEVSDAIYNSRWYNCDVSISKKLFFILMIAQTPVKLTAFGFANVNFKSFTKILSTAWSYFALLRTLYSTI